MQRTDVGSVVIQYTVAVYMVRGFQSQSNSDEGTIGRLTGILVCPSICINNVL